jgi:hypothetical protein
MAWCIVGNTESLEGLGQLKRLDSCDKEAITSTALDQFQYLERRVLSGAPRAKLGSVVTHKLIQKHIVSLASCSFPKP